MTVVRVPISDDQPGAYVEFDVEEQDEDGTEPLARRRDGTTLAAHSLARSLDTSLPALSLILSKVRSAAAGCDEICLQLGLRVGGETGLVFVRGGADATIGVTVTWRAGDRPTDGPATASGNVTGEVDGAG